MSDLVERLERAICRNVNGEPLDDIDRAAVEAAARLRELEAALKPFADFALSAQWAPNEATITEGSSMACRQLTIGDCRAARQALGGDNG